MQHQRNESLQLGTDAQDDYIVLSGDAPRRSSTRQSTSQYASASRRVSEPAAQQARPPSPSEELYRPEEVYAQLLPKSSPAY